MAAIPASNATLDGAEKRWLTLPKTRGSSPSRPMANRTRLCAMSTTMITVVNASRPPTLTGMRPR